MTQKRIKKTPSSGKISEKLKLLRKKRNEAVLAVGKVDREIDEAIAKAKIPQLKVGDVFVSNSTPSKWFAAIITLSHKPDLEPLKIRHSTNLGIHCRAQTIIINICSPGKMDHEYGYPNIPINLEWIFNSENWHHSRRIRKEKTGEIDKYPKERWQIHEFQDKFECVSERSIWMSIALSDPKKDLSLVKAPDDNPKHLDKHFLAFRYGILFELCQVLPHGNIEARDCNQSLIVPLRWYKVTRQVRYFKKQLNYGECVIFLHDGLYNSKLQIIFLYSHISKNGAFSFNSFQLIPTNEL